MKTTTFSLLLVLCLFQASYQACDAGYYEDVDGIPDTESEAKMCYQCPKYSNDCSYDADNF